MFKFVAYGSRLGRVKLVHPTITTQYTMDRRVWCAIAGKDRLLHVDITNCNLVYDLRKAAVDLSRIKIPYVRVDIWKVRAQESYTTVWSRTHVAFYRSRIQDNSLSQMLLH